MPTPHLIKLQEYQDERVQKTLDDKCQPALLQQAVQNEWRFLDDLDWEEKTVIDIGCGDSRHALKYAPLCKKYIGIDIAHDMIALSAERLKANNIFNAPLIHTDAEYLDRHLDPEIADRVLCMYFGAGNLRKDNFDVENYALADIQKNEKFIAIIKQMNRVLKKGSIYLTVYKDTKETQDMQYEFYEGTGQHIITKRSDPFTATEEGFWSLRFTEELMLGNLEYAGIEKDQVTFHDLNRISWIVEIEKAAAAS